jgi:hypothetical protein
LHLGKREFAYVFFNSLRFCIVHSLTKGPTQNFDTFYDTKFISLEGGESGYSPNYSDTTVKLQLFFLAKKESNVIAFLTISQVVEQKELTIAEIENKKLQEQEAAEMAAEKLAKKESESCNSPRKDKWQSILEIPEIASMSEKMIRHQLNRSAQAIV